MSHERVENNKPGIDFNAILASILKVNFKKEETVVNVVKTLKNNNCNIPQLLAEFTKSDHPKLLKLVATLCRITGNAFEDWIPAQLRNRFQPSEFKRLREITSDPNNHQNWVTLFRTTQPEAQTGKVLETAPESNQTLEVA